MTYFEVESQFLGPDEDEVTKKPTDQVQTALPI
jgi:hypothetical protein